VLFGIAIGAQKKTKMNALFGEVEREEKLFTLEKERTTTKKACCHCQY
jgi:hypothetical protein